MKTSTTPNRWWDIWAALFLIFALMSAATRLYTTQWTSDLERVQYLTLIGGILGLALGQSRFSARIVRLFAAVYTLFFITWQIGLMQGEDIQWTERLYSLGIRLSIAANQFLSSQEVNDSILFIVLMSFLFWLLGMTAGYFLTRHGNYWASLIPSGIGILIINHFDPANPSWGRTVGAYLFFSLLLIGRMTYMRYKQDWQAKGIAQPPETGFDLGRAMVVVVVIIFMLSWTVPAVAASSGGARELWVSITHPWQTLRDRMGDMVSSLRSTVGVVSDFYGDTLSLGTGTLLGDDVVFTVEANTQKPPGARYYWRALSYDTYRNGGWDNTATEAVPYTPSDQNIQSFDWAARQQIEFQFRSYVSLLRTFYTGPTPLYISKSGQVVTNEAPKGIADVVKVTANPPLSAGTQYTTTSWVGVPSVVELRSSTMDYPDWVKDRYLQLPANLPDRIPNLAKEITRGLEGNPYDEVQAVTEWLRDNISYAEKIPNPPSGQEPLEWFLFDIKKGYCNYYASAEVIMLRSLGIPARLAVGFAQGEVEEGRDVYTVRHKDAHAWPEVYFEGYGWIEFEPTVSQAAREFPLSEGLGEDLERGPNPSGPGQLPLDPNPEGPGADIAGGPRLTPESRTGLYMGLVSGSGLALFFIWRYARLKRELPALPIFLEQRLMERGVAVPGWLKNWAKRVVASPLEKAYNSVNQGLRLLGQPPDPSVTPNERAANFSRLVPAAEEPLEQLMTEYEKGTYSPYPADVQAARLAGTKIRRLSWRTRLKKFLREE